ncbi:hypothetical protein ACSBR2_017617 [Camellia fascicularis]
MEIFLVKRLKDWTATLDGTEKVNFCNFGINALFLLSHTSRCFSFLHAATRCWNPSYSCVSLWSTRDVSYSRRVSSINEVLAR